MCTRVQELLKSLKAHQKYILRKLAFRLLPLFVDAFETGANKKARTEQFVRQRLGVGEGVMKHLVEGKITRIEQSLALLRGMAALARDDLFAIPADL